MLGFISRLRLRANMVQEAAVEFPILGPQWRRPANWTQLPDPGDGTNLGLTIAGFGSAVPYLMGSNSNGNIVTEKAETLFNLPACYVAGQSITFRGIVKCVVVPNGGATLDLVARSDDKDQTLSADICATAAIAITSAYANADFTITPTGLSPGDSLYMELTSVANDTGGGGGNTKVRICRSAMLLDIKG